MGRMAFVGVLDCRDRRNVLGCVRGGLVREFTELMAQTIVARVRIPQLLWLTVHMPRGLAS